MDTNPLTTLLPLAVVRGGIPAPYREGLGLSRGDQLWAVISRHDRRAADEWLASRGLRPAARGETDGASTDDGDGVDVA